MGSPILSVFGHVSAQPVAVAALFGGIHSNTVNPVSDLALFVINPSAGIDQRTIDLWSEVSTYQTPRLILVTGLDGSDFDFEDAVTIANKVFDQVVTPFLVLHDDHAAPIALIDLETLEIHDYSRTSVQHYMSDKEHLEVINDFREEYLEHIEAAGENAFEAGLLFPAIPLVMTNNIGIAETKNFINRIVSPGVSDI